MEANELMRYAYELLQGHSNEECARILREVVAECQVCIKNCEEGVLTTRIWKLLIKIKENLTQPCSHS